jgi:hypothetical protein
MDLVGSLVTITMPLVKESFSGLQDRLGLGKINGYAI